MTKQMVIAALEKKMMEEKKQNGDKMLIKALKFAIDHLEQEVENHDYD